MPFFAYIDLVNIRLEIMLSDFHRKKETLLTIKNRIFQSPENRIFFPNGLIQALDQKMPNSSLFTFGHNKTRYNA